METVEQIGKGKSGTVRRWIMELDLADKQESDWRADSEKVISTYRGEDNRSSDIDGGGTKLNRQTFNILWSNTETLRPALYNSQPKPVVKRRFRDKDPLGGAVSRVLERALEYSIDTYDFNERMILAIDDYLLPGRGVTRVRYVPTFQEADEGDGSESPASEDESEDADEPQEELSYEEVVCEHVNWEDFRRGPGRIWSEVPWIAFRHKLTREELNEKFGEEIGEEVPLNLSSDDGDEDGSDKYDEPEEVKTILNRAEIWEVWDKESGKVYFISKGYKKGPLSEEDDPLNLTGFFPIPRPLYSMESSNSLVPVPEYQLYETLAEELNRVTNRIMKILDGLRLRGVYDSTLSELDQLFEKGDNKMIPAENLSKIIQQGGIEASIWMMPIRDHAQVLQQLYQYRQALIQNIYEITGISDVIRGATDARETASAQQIKSQWGSLRLQRRQREIQRYARDLIRLKAELIGENFSIETLQLMTGLDYPTNQQKQMAQIALQQASYYQNANLDEQQQAQLQQRLQQAQETLQKPSWEQIKQVMGNDMLRQFKVDIETDSTVAEQMAEEKQQISELLTSVVEYINGVGPAVQNGYIPMEAAKSMLMAAVRRFKLGSEVEDALEDIGQQQSQGQQQTSPEVQEQQLELQKQQREAEFAQQKHQWEMEKLQMEMRKERAEHQMEMQQIQAQSNADVTEQAAQAEHDVIKSRVSNGG